LGSGEEKPLQRGHALEVDQPGIANLGSLEPKIFQRGHALEVDQGRVAHLGCAKIDEMSFLNDRQDASVC